MAVPGGQAAPVLSPAARAIAARCEARINELARRMSREDFDRVPQYEALPDDMKDVEIAATVRHGLRLFLRGVQGAPDAGDREYRFFRERAAQRAEEGMPLNLLLGTHLLGQHMLWRTLRESARPGDEEALLELADFLLAGQRGLVAAVAESYLDEQAAIAAEQREHRRTLVRALLEGYPLAPARYEELGVAGGGLVLALGLGESGAEPPSLVAGRRRVRRVQTALERVLGRSALTLLEPGGGSVVLPGSPAGELPELPAELAERLGRACGEEVLVAVAAADSAAGLAQAARTAAEVLRIVRTLGRAPGCTGWRTCCWSTTSRPGESSAGLAALLDPVYERPELLATLRAYLAERQDRRRTARVLGLHPNTVDNRLARIGELIGTEVTSPQGFALLLTAQTVRVLRPES